MAKKILQGRMGALRVYDAANHYVEIPFVQMDLSAPIARNRPVDPITPTVGGAFSAPTGADYDSGFYEPITLNFSLWSNDSINKAIVDSFSNPYLSSPWTVNGVTWSTTKGRGSVIFPDGSYRPTLAFFDQKKVSVCFEARWQHPQSGSIVGYRWDEAYISPQNITVKESADFVNLEIQALIYGNVSAITGFTSGTSST